MGAAGFEPEPEGPARFAARAASGRLQILRGHHLLLASARRKMMGAAGFEPEQDLAPLGLAGFESFTDSSGSSRPLVAQKWALQALVRLTNESAFEL